VPREQEDDPSPLPERPFPPFAADELVDLLRHTDNEPTPGLSSLAPPRMGLERAAGRSFYCLRHQAWRLALVQDIPKPDRPDYHAAKAYRQMSLLDSSSKLLEKAVAKRF